MIYNGFDFAPWFDTRLVTRSLLPEYEIATRDVPGQPGSRFMRAELKPLTIDVAAAWRARPADDMAALRRLMASRLLCLKEAELWLDDERHLGLRYMAVLTSPGALDTLWHTGEATLTFTAYDPVAVGAEGRATVSGTWRAGGRDVPHLPHRDRQARRQHVGAAADEHGHGRVRANRQGGDGIERGGHRHGRPAGHGGRQPRARDLRE